MLKYLLILLIELLFYKVSAQYCSSSQISYQAYNINNNVLISLGANLWNFNIDTNKFLSNKFSLTNVYGRESFEWVDTAFSFNFDDCDRSEERDFCQIVSPARDIVIAIGQRKNETESRKYGYIAYRADPSGELKPMSDSEMPWGLKVRGTLTGDFWISQSGHWVYESSVFFPAKNELYASIFDTSSGSDSKYHLMMRRLENSGKWSEKWVEVIDAGFYGMFHISGRLFGMDKKNVIHEITWRDNKVRFTKISSAKEFFNCYENSTLVSPIITTESITTVEELDNNEIASTEPIIILTDKTYITSELIETETESNTISWSVENSTLLTAFTTVTTDTNLIGSETNQTKQKSSSLTWSAIVLVVILILISLAILIAYIIFRKRRTKTVYLNSKSNGTQLPEKTISDSSVITIRSKFA